MKVRDYTTVAPLNECPTGPLVPSAERREAVDDALRGVEVGTYDDEILDFLVRHLDNPTLRTLVSLIERARQAGACEAFDLQLALDERSGVGPLGPSDPSAQWASGNSGPGAP